MYTEHPEQLKDFAARLSGIPGCMFAVNRITCGKDDELPSQYLHSSLPSTWFQGRILRQGRTIEQLHHHEVVARQRSGEGD